MLNLDAVFQIAGNFAVCRDSDDVPRHPTHGFDDIDSNVKAITQEREFFRVHCIIAFLFDEICQISNVFAKVGSKFYQTLNQF